MFSTLFLLIALGQLVLFGLFVRALVTRRQLADLIPLVLTGLLAYENAVLGLGRWIGEGELLSDLNAPRFIGHALLTPLLIVWGFVLLRRQQVAWTLRTPAAVSVGLITAALVAYGVNHDIVHLALAPEQWQDTLRYANDNAPAGPPLTAILTGLALIVAGAQLWIESRAVNLVVASSVMAMVAGLAGFFPVLGNLGELVLMAGILSALSVHASSTRVRRAVVSRRAQQVGWIAWPVFFFGSLMTFIPMFGTMDPADKLPVSALQYDVASASQGAWLVLMVLHAHFAISVFGLAKSGSRLRKFHVWFGYANLLLCFGGQLLFIFPQTATLGSHATTLVFVTITVHVILGAIFAVRRRGSRKKPNPRAERGPALQQVAG
ncbi:hypothetical protein [Melissospora conviva]|uniref:hypothetical protein n=1 Tax=Melissospora conviva TaxID=3388432 RepID=UPI003C19D263